MNNKKMLMYIIIAIILMVSFLVALLHFLPKNESISEVSSTSQSRQNKIENKGAAVINKSKRDERQYEIHYLKNGMKVLLISDDKAIKSLAAVALPFGSLSDPKSQQGLAHYTEHMVLMGSKKYPKPSSFSEFLNQHAGSYNASTGQTRTAYFFEVQPSAFSEAADRLADALANPLLDPIHSDKERNAVNAELTMARSNDAFRLALVDSETINQAHPASYFSGGNLETLSDKPNSVLQTELDKFYKNHYSADQMVAILYSHDDLNSLKQLAETTFGRIKNHAVKDVQINENALSQHYLSQWFFVEPAQAKKVLYLQFPIENNLNQFKQKSDEYIAYMLNSRSEGTLFNQLQTQGLIESISAYPYPNRYGNSGQFSIYITLTDKGLTEKDKIIASVMSYLKLIKTKGIDARYYNEMQNLWQLAFNYPDISRDMRYVEWLADQMLVYPTEHILDADYIATDFNPNAIKRRIEQLTLDNARIWVIAPNQKTDKTAYFVNTPYRTEPITQEQKKSISTESEQLRFSLPELNQYIPNDLSILKQTNVDKPLQFNPKGNLIHLVSNYFADEPKASIILSLRNDMAINTSKNQVMFSLIDYLVNRELSELQYQASEAGIELNTQRDNGVMLQATGFSQHLSSMLLTLLEHYKTLDINADNLALAKADYLQKLNRSDQEKSFMLAIEPFNALSFPYYFTKDERKKVIDSISTDDVSVYLSQLIKQSSPYLMTLGNITEQQSQVLYQQIKQKIGDDGNEFHPVANIKIHDVGSALLTQTAKSSDNALFMSYIPPLTNRIKDRIQSDLLTKIVSPLFYDQLRTNEQLGYAVFTLPAKIGENTGIAFLIQSNNANPHVLQQRFEAFYPQIQTKMNALTPESFEQYKQSLITELTDAPQTLTDEMNQYLPDFLDNNFSFDTKELKIKAIEALTLTELKTFAEKLFQPNGAFVVVSQVLGDQTKGENTTITGFTPYANAEELQSYLKTH